MIIGLYGDSRAGKDTTARIMQEEFSFEWRSFAAPLRQILYNINPYLSDWAGEAVRYQDAIRDFGLDGTKKYFPESVDMMIALGQSVRDLIHEDAWIWSVFTDPLPKNMVISDVRQPNEYEAIINAGGEVWRIIRPGTTRREMDGLLDDRHFAITLYNNTNQDDFRHTVILEVQDALQNRWNRSRPDDGASIIHY